MFLYRNHIIQWVPDDTVLKYHRKEQTMLNQDVITDIIDRIAWWMSGRVSP